MHVFLLERVAWSDIKTSWYILVVKAVIQRTRVSLLCLFLPIIILLKKLQSYSEEMRDEFHSQTKVRSRTILDWVCVIWSCILLPLDWRSSSTPSLHHWRSRGSAVRKIFIFIKICCWRILLFILSVHWSHNSTLRWDLRKPSVAQIHLWTRLHKSWANVERQSRVWKRIS